jgi:hypothetical protein
MAIPEFSVIIASYDRHESLRRLLAGIGNHFGQSDVLMKSSSPTMRRRKECVSTVAVVDE